MILTVITLNDEWNDPFCDLCYEAVLMRIIQSKSVT